MKYFLSFLIFAATTAQAATIRFGAYNSATDSIDLNVTYAGGCKEHKWKLEIGSCQESMPVRCPAKLVDLTTDDYCEAIVARKVSLPLDITGLKTPYYKGASLEIHGDNSAVQITLP